MKCRFKYRCGVEVMKAILTVVFVTSIFTLFVQSATAMPPNDPAFYEAQDALQPWFQILRQRIISQPGYEQVKNGMGSTGFYCEFLLGRKGEFALLESRMPRWLEIDRAALNLIDKCAPLPLPPNETPYEKRIVIHLAQSLDKPDIFVLPFRSWGPGRFR